MQWNEEKSKSQPIDIAEFALLVRERFMMDIKRTLGTLEDAGVMDASYLLELYSSFMGWVGPFLELTIDFRNKGCVDQCWTEVDDIIWREYFDLHTRFQCESKVMSALTGQDAVLEDDLLTQEDEQWVVQEIRKRTTAQARRTDLLQKRPATPQSRKRKNKNLTYCDVQATVSVSISIVQSSVYIEE
ncbi:hypothetical protein ACUUL3_04865 [Thiovibrio sp. JS02]